jgi:hypothetical protein
MSQRARAAVPRQTARVTAPNYQKSDLDVVILEACPRILAQNLQATAITRVALVAAHHIVAGSAKRAAPARRVLRRYGTGINDAVNGQFLPIRGSSAPGAYHPRTHTNTYYDAVNDRVVQAGSRSELEQILTDIGEELAKDIFPR